MLSILRGIIICIWSLFLNKKKTQEDCFLSQEKMIVLHPDGTWTLKSKQNQTSSYYSYGTNNTQSFNSYASQTSDPRPINTPPHDFPQKAELEEKLRRCIDLGVILSCSHKICDNNVYILDIQIPYDSQNEKSWNQYRRFVKAMEDKYNFETIQEERVSSKVSCEKYYSVSFEYDARKQLFKKK